MSSNMTPKMLRMLELQKFAEKKLLGMEIAPYSSPIVRKSDGYNVLSVDIFDTETLRELALDRGRLTEENLHLIEEVDIVANATEIQDALTKRDLIGKVDYILSSHNFEHLPNPIKFLQGCSAALRPGGTLSMAIPDYRMCFDHFRMPTKLSDWLEAFHHGHTQPTPETLFDFDANTSGYHTRGKVFQGMSNSWDDPSGFLPRGNLRKSYSNYVENVKNPSAYRDVHCNVVFGASLELLLSDLRHLGLIDLETVQVLPTRGLEFIIHLRKASIDESNEESDEAFYERRLGLLREMNSALGIAGVEKHAKAFPRPKTPPKTPQTRPYFRRMAHKVLGDEKYEKLKRVRTRLLSN